MSGNQRQPPKPFQEQASPQLSDSSDREAPGGLENAPVPALHQQQLQQQQQKQPRQHKEAGKGNKDLSEPPEDRTLTAEDEEINHVVLHESISRTNSTASSSAQPTSGHSNSEFSEDGQENYRMSIESKNKGKKKKTSNTRMVSVEEGTHHTLLMDQFAYNWRHKQELRPFENLEERESFAINENTSVRREVKFLPLISEKCGERVVKLLITMTVDDQNYRKYQYMANIDVTLYDAENTKIVEHVSEKCSFSENTKSGTFIINLVPFDKVRKVQSESLQIHIDTKVKAVDTSNDYVLVPSLTPSHTHIT